MNEEDTFIRLRMGNLETRKDMLNKRVSELSLDQNLVSFDEFRKANKELLDVHAEMIKILQEEAEKIDEELERRK